MQKNESPAYWSMLGLSLAFSILAVVTMLPNPAASKPNVLGYRSVCSFAPAATALCGLLAGISCTLRNRRVSRAAASMRYRPLILPTAVGLALLTVALVFGIRFGNAQARSARSSPRHGWRHRPRARRRPSSRRGREARPSPKGTFRRPWKLP